MYEASVNDVVLWMFDGEMRWDDGRWRRDEKFGWQEWTWLRGWAITWHDLCRMQRASHIAVGLGGSRRQDDWYFVAS